MEGHGDGHHDRPEPEPKAQGRWTLIVRGGMVEQWFEWSPYNKKFTCSPCACERFLLFPPTDHNLHVGVTGNTKSSPGVSDCLVFMWPCNGLGTCSGCPLPLEWNKQIKEIMGWMD